MSRVSGTGGASMRAGRRRYHVISESCLGREERSTDDLQEALALFDSCGNGCETVLYEHSTSPGRRSWNVLLSNDSDSEQLAEERALLEASR